MGIPAVVWQKTGQIMQIQDLGAPASRLGPDALLSKPHQRLSTEELVETTPIQTTRTPPADHGFNRGKLKGSQKCRKLMSPFGK